MTLPDVTITTGYRFLWGRGITEHDKLVVILDIFGWDRTDYQFELLTELLAMPGTAGTFRAMLSSHLAANYSLQLDQEDIAVAVDALVAHYRVAHPLYLADAHSAFPQTYV